jgi:hypothetical protein
MVPELVGMEIALDNASKLIQVLINDLSDFEQPVHVIG